MLRTFWFFAVRRGQGSLCILRQPGGADSYPREHTIEEVRSPVATRCFQQQLPALRFRPKTLEQLLALDSTGH